MLPQPSLNSSALIQDLHFCLVHSIFDQATSTLRLKQGFSRPNEWAMRTRL